MPHRATCPQLVGRAHELQALDEALARAGRGQPATVVVGGDAGIGKTRLVEHFAVRARDRGALVATGRCVPVDGGGLPYGPMVGLLRELARLTTDRSIGELASGLWTALGLTRPNGDEPPRRVTDDLGKTRLFEAILAFVVAVADRVPLVLVVEDLQWADSASTELVGFLNRNLGTDRVVLIATYRTDDVGPGHRLRPWFAELRRHPRVVHLALEGLDADELGLLVTAILGRRPEPALLDGVRARSQGNPFFAEELVAAGASRALPAELRDVLLTRIGSVSADGRQVLRMVAAAGNAVPYELLRALDVLDVDVLDAALTETVDDQLLVVDNHRPGFRFRHELLREAVDDAMLPGERQRLHRAIATAITVDPTMGPEGPGHRSAELAAHWWIAGEWEAALEAAGAAADAAVAVWAFPEALAHLERALTLLDRVPARDGTAAERPRLLGIAADAAYLAGMGARSVELATAALAVDSDADRTARLDGCLRLGRNAWAVGDADAAFAAFREARSLVAADPPSAELARVLGEEARGLMLMSRHAEAEHVARQALAVADAAGSHDEETHIISTLGCAVGMLGRYEEGIELEQRALAMAEEHQDPFALDRTFANLVHLLMEAGRLDEAVALVFDRAAPGEQLSGVRLNGAAINGSEALIRLGRYDQAEALLARVGGRNVGICAPGPPLAATMLAVRQGWLDDAVVLLGWADVETTGYIDVQGRGVYHLRAAELALAHGRTEDAYRHVERGLALAAGTDDTAFGSEMGALAVRCLADDVEDARTRRRRYDVDKAKLLALGFEQEIDRVIDAPAERSGRCPPRAEAFAAMCTAERSRLDTSDPARWDEAARRWEVAGEPHPLAYCRWRQAEALLAQRAGRGQAAECLHQAWQLAAGMGAAPLQAEIERLATRARLELAGPETSDAAGSTVGTDLGLTRREVEVLGHLAAGRTDREIAESLFISKKTVSVHVSSVLRKLDVPNRLEAGRVGQALGVIEPAGQR